MPPTRPPAVLDLDAGTPGFVLEAPIPGQPDRFNTFTFSGGAPLTEAVLFKGTARGETPVEGCVGMTIGVAAPEVAGTITTDELGRGLFEVEIAAATANDTLYFQVVQPERCLESALVAQRWSVDELVGSWIVEIAEGKITGTSDTDLLGTRVDFDAAPNADGDGDGLADLLVGAVWHEAAGPYAGATYVFYAEPDGVRDASVADAVLLGEDPYDWAGIDSSWAGDVNGDGFADMLIGARNSDDGGAKSGNSYLVLGPVFGSHSLSDAAYTRFTGEGPDDLSGAELDGVGDVDGDGRADFLIGAESNDGPSVDSGAVYLTYGLPPAGNVHLSQPDAKLTGTHEGDQVGGRMAALGDMNDDGFDDFAVGALGVDAGEADRGAVYIVHGPIYGANRLQTASAAVIHGAAGGDLLGSAVHGPGDVNGDGEPDLVVAARGESSGGALVAGAVYVLHGPLHGAIDVDTYAMRVRGNGEGDHLGAMLDACDVTGDGEVDLLLAAKYEGYGGMVHLFHGPLTGDWMAADADAEFLSRDEDARLGQDVACGGDFDGDGIADFVIGAELADGGAGNASGAAYTFRGR